MRILFLTQVLPYPLNTGAKVRQYYVLRHLAARHEVTLASFTRADDTPESVNRLRAVCRAVHTVPLARSFGGNLRAVAVGLASGLPIVIARDDVAAMRHLVARLLRNGGFDAVHADQVSMAQYGLLGQGVRRVLDLHNALHLVTGRLAANERNPLRRLLYQRETRALARYEAGLCRQFDRVVFVSDDDRRAIQSPISNPQSPISPPQSPLPNLSSPFHTIPICVDPADKRPVTPAARPFRATFLGPMFWPPNAEGALWFARQAWPLARAAAPHLRLTLAGKDPPAAVRALAAPGQVDVTGYVADLSRLLAETAVWLVPLRSGSGMQVKILDGWCWGLPAVTTSVGAEGIALRDGENILIADGAEAFAAAVVRVADDPVLAAALRRNGRRWVEERYDWRKAYAAWDEVYAG